MAYNNLYPMNYSPYYQMPSNSPQNASGGIIWVQGEAGAKSYLVAPNTTVQLWDSEAQTIYLKSADASGMPSMKVLDYTIREASERKQNVADNNIYVTRDELSKFEEKIRKMVREAHNESTVQHDEK